MRVMLVIMRIMIKENYDLRKMIKECKGLSYPNRLKRLNLTSFETRCVRGDLLFYFKIIKGLDKSNARSYFDINKRSTRVHNLKIKKRQWRTNIGRYKFSNRVVNIWNELPAEIVESRNINEFKSGLDHYLRTTRGLE